MRETTREAFLASFLDKGHTRRSTYAGTDGIRTSYYDRSEAIPFARMTIKLEGQHGLPSIYYFVRDTDDINPAAEFHRQKGCCDGNDPTGCWRRQQEEAARIERETRETNRARRAGPRSEYEGTD